MLFLFRRRQCIDHALKKTKVEVKSEPVVKADDKVVKTNGIHETKVLLLIL